MQNNNHAQKAFSIHKITKSKSFSAFTSALLAIFLGLVIGFIVMIIANPAKAFTGFQTVLFGGFSRLGNVFYFATPILMTGLAVGFAFKMGLFNIGASGQYTMGMFFALYVGFMWDLPDGIHWIACIIAGMIGGMMWGFIPGVFKALLNVNEVITSIMFNYIGMYLVDMMIQGNATMYVASTTRTAYLPTSAQIPSLGVRNSSVNVSIYIAIFIAIVLFIILNKTTFGYELKATGYNKHASKYAGMNGTRNIILTMVIAGGLAGLGGAFAILAPATIQGSSMTYEPINIIAANGFNGIAVALLGNSSPIGIIFSAVFISHIQRGGSLTSLYGYKPEIIDIVIAIIIYFSAFSMLMKSAASSFLRKNRKHVQSEDVDPRINSEGPALKTGVDLPDKEDMDDDVYITDVTDTSVPENHEIKNHGSGSEEDELMKHKGQDIKDSNPAEKEEV
ncbi:ABC transporter permease [Mobilitalea sibirica]|uniref:ABC transporter permease n=1 Tax=Mobilitalea sibirica TaxID=1462919 RepID=A0A8J7L2X9_9FIRM|nr:ABC transporter permease [Mobilitalea sibirica]MBH1941408.1 ABC transporter permease [Mobilitalea sibirica]